MKLGNKNTSFKSEKRNRLPLYVGSVVAVLLIGAGIFYYLTLQNNRTAKQDSSNPGYNTVDYTGPSDEDKAYNDQIKENLGKEAAPEQGSSGPRTTTVITIVDASQYGSAVEVRAFANKTVESDGKCTITFTKGDAKVVKTVSATAGAQTTTCENVAIDRSEFSSAGKWNLVVAYDSSATSGKSENREVTLQ